MPDLRITVDGADFARRFQVLAGSLAGFRPFLQAAGDLLLASVERRFATESGPGGRKWPQSLAARCEHRQTLTKSGRLRRSFRTRIGADGLSLGTDVPYAPIHQVGGVIRAKTPAGLRFRICPGGPLLRKRSVRIPARPFLGIADDDRSALATLFTRHLSTALAAGTGPGEGGVPAAGGSRP